MWSAAEAQDEELFITGTVRPEGDVTYGRKSLTEEYRGRMDEALLGAIDCVVESDRYLDPRFNDV